MVTAKQPLWPNLYVILIGRPGIGKTMAISGVRSLVQATHVEGIFEPVCHLAPVDVTKAALYDWLASKKVRRSCQDPEAEALEVKASLHYHSGYLAVSELSDIFREHDNALIGCLHSLYDNVPLIEEERRYRQDQPIKIPRPQMSFLGGTTPAYISRTFPPQAWDEGFMARTILVYSSEQQEPDLFDLADSDILLAKDLVEDLRTIGKLHGEMKFSPDAKNTIRAWQKNGKLPAPTHIRLEHYKTRRMVHALKLSTLASVDRGNSLVVEVEDFQRALEWMLEAEDQMPQIFMEMVGKSDSQVLNELYYFAKTLWDSPGRAGQPIRRGLLVNFLSGKVPAWLIDKVIETAVGAELLEKILVGHEVRYKPAPRPGLYKKKPTEQA